MTMCYDNTRVMVTSEQCNGYTAEGEAPGRPLGRFLYV